MSEVRLEEVHFLLRKEGESMTWPIRLNGQLFEDPEFVLADWLEHKKSMLAQITVTELPLGDDK